MATKWPQGEITPNQPATVLGGNNISGVYTLDQLNRLNADFGPQMQRSLRFRSSASAYLNRTLSSGNRKTWTWSGWVKRGVLGSPLTLFGTTGSSTDSTFLWFGFSNDKLAVSRATAFMKISSSVYRDPSAWYHIVVAFDTTQAIASDRLRLYVNGVQIGAFDTDNPPTLNADYGINLAQAHYLSTYNGSGQPFDGYMAEVNFIDGQALDPSYFGKYNGTTGVWQPIFYTGSYGTNGFRLTFADNTSTTTLGYDSSPNGNNWTTNNISLTAGSTYDSMLDVPTNWTSGNPIQARGNYAVLNPLATGLGSATTANANLQLTGTTSAFGAAISSIGMTSGKWYYEGVLTTTSGPGDGSGFGIYGVLGTAWVRNETTQTFLSTISGVASITPFGTNFTTGDIIGVAFDATNGTLNFYKNGSAYGTQITGIPSSNWFFYSFARASSSTSVLAANFGQRPFSYTPPTGFISLCTQNLSQPTVFNGASFMAATLYTGNGSTQSIINAVNGVSFQPDFVWVKSRSAATDHALYDVIRGTQNRLESNTTDAAVASDNGLTAFGTSGFTVNTLAQVNTNAATYVGWQWKAGGTAVTNNAGSISSQVSANTTAGFSVVTYTGNGTSGATVGHGLGVAPKFMIVKSRSSVTNWYVYSASLPDATYYLALNATDAQSNAAGSTLWNSTAPTSSLITLGTSISTNANTTNYAIYAFAAIAGYSAFGSYTGNGSTDGPFIYTGFRPRFVLFKNTTDGTVNWFIFDSARNTYNAVNGGLCPSNNGSENVSAVLNMDLLSNGFKLRNTNNSQNVSGNVYIYAAFAENPFKYSLAR